MGERFDGHAIERSQGGPTTAGGDIAGSLAGHVEPYTIGPNDDSDGYEYRVLHRTPGSETWHLVITNRGGGRPFRSLGAARGVLTREKNAHAWCKQHNPRPPEEVEWCIQRRPVEAKWETIDGPSR